MAASKTDEKLSKLASFGQSAGSKPAAAAAASLSSQTPQPVVGPVPAREEVNVSDESKTPPTQNAAAVGSKLLVRNVGFNVEDQRHLDRISSLLQEGGEFRPSIADLVRVALRCSEGLTAVQAKAALEESRKFDVRRRRSVR